MNIKKTVKKIVSLGMGLTMVGSTIMGAMAATLSQYPAPFTSAGSFNALMVVGSTAQPSDIVGVTDIATSLQYATKKVVSTTSTTAVSVSEGVQLEKTGAHLYGNLSLHAMQDTDLDHTDLPTILKDLTFKDSKGTNKQEVDYTQKLNIDPTGTGTQVYFNQDDTDMPNAGVYLHLDDASNVYAYKYTLEFTTAVTFDNTSSTTAKDDLKTNSIELLGKTYTITDATVTSGVLTKVTMLAGKTTQTIAKGTPVTVNVDGTDYKVEVLGVTTNNDKCQVAVNGVVTTVDVDDTAEISGLEVGITDAAHIEGGTDSCQVNVGANKLVLEDGQEVNVNSNDIDGSIVDLTFDTNDKWTGFNIQAQPEDDVFLKEGESWTDPVFGAFKFIMGGEHADREEIKLIRSGKKATLTFMNYDNKQVELNWYMNTSGATRLAFGDNMIDDRIYLQGEYCTGTTSVEDCEGSRFLAVTSSNVAHVIEIKNVDTTNNKIDFEDLTYAGSDKDNAYTEGWTNASSTGESGAVSIPISGFGDVQFIINETQKIIKFNNTGAANSIKTSGEGVMAIYDPQGDGQLFNLTEKTDDDFPTGTYVNNVITVSETNDTSNNEIDLAYSVKTATLSFGQKDLSDDDSDNKKEQTYWGSVINYDSKDDDSIVIMYPDARVYYDAYVAPIAAITSTSEVSGLSEIVAIGSGATKLDTEVADYKAQNLIVVGGPCVNTVAANLMGNPANCAEGFEQGKAMIKLFSHDNGKVALLVAGYSAQDTRAACMWLHDYAKDANKAVLASATEGKSVELAVASLSSVTPTVK